MAPVDHVTVEPARRTPRASDEPRASGRGSSRTSPARGNGVAPQKPQRPAPPTTKQEQDEAPGYGWTLFLGAIIGLALVKEIFGRMGASPVTVRAKSVSRSVYRRQKVFSIATLVGMIERMGARVLGMRA